jgi:hypothetical protein
MHMPSGAIEQVCALFPCTTLSPPFHLPPPLIALSRSSPIPKTSQETQKAGIPSSELLKRLLVVGVVGINVASKAASRNGESGALLHEERSRGRAGEGSRARASCAADQGGDGHCVCGWYVRAEMEEGVVILNRAAFGRCC